MGESGSDGYRARYNAIQLNFEPTINFLCEIQICDIGSIIILTYTQSLITREWHAITIMATSYQNDENIPWSIAQVSASCKLH